MSQEFHTIYEHGILRPLTPLNLPKFSVVTGTLHQEAAGGTPVPIDPLLGSTYDDAELLDAIVEDAMAARESHPFRTDRG